MINTLNETHLHKTLKTLYAMQVDGSRTESKVGPYIADIVRPNGDIIEIQTSSLGHLAQKIKYFIEGKHKVTVVFPLAATKYIETHNNGLIKKRRSPLKKNIYSIFRELTALAPFLLDRYFCLEVLEITMTEIRQATETPVQSLNGRRRFRKSWLKIGKRLEEIHATHTFYGQQSYAGLLPHTLPKEFTIKELYAPLKQEYGSLSQDSLRLLLWVYQKAGIIEHIGKRGRANLYIQI